MKTFSQAESDLLEQIIRHRRDVRGNRFLQKPIPEEALQKVLEAAVHAPSVGFSQPWDFVIITHSDTKNQIKDLFSDANKEGSDSFEGKKKEQYDELKLEGIVESPINIAVFYKPSQHPVLGQTAMPEVGRYSVVCAIQNMWLMARSLNIGMGWVSILDPEKVKGILQAPKDYELIAYLCLGFVDTFYERPELEIKEWDTRKSLQEIIHYERYQNE
ncbi:MAG: 5,6-dimethylbenzimidazole synthase [Bacteroidota bacterium]